jgi:hypothetical protein
MPAARDNRDLSISALGTFLFLNLNGPLIYCCNPMHFFRLSHSFLLCVMSRGFCAVSLVSLTHTLRAELKTNELCFNTLRWIRHIVFYTNAAQRHSIKWIDLLGTILGHVSFLNTVFVYNFSFTAPRMITQPPSTSV